jgi:hyperosmotically inducible protein
MRRLLILLSLLAMSGCTALVVGGAGVVGYQLGKDERPPSVVTSDSAITTRIKGKYAADDVVSVFSISVRTYEGTVTLSGTVGSILARDRAESLARETNGVNMVNNQITIEDRSK